MFSHEDLTAYLDGELTPDKTAAIDAALADDPALAARLEALDLDKAALTAAFAPLLDMAPAPVLPAKSHRATLALVASVLLGAGIGLGSHLMPAKTSWQQEVAHYQALYVADTLSGIGPDEARLAAVEKCWGQAGA